MRLTKLPQPVVAVTTLIAFGCADQPARVGARPQSSAQSAALEPQSPRPIATPRHAPSRVSASGISLEGTRRHTSTGNRPPEWIVTNLAGRPRTIRIESLSSLAGRWERAHAVLEGGPFALPPRGKLYLRPGHRRPALRSGQSGWTRNYRLKIRVDGATTLEAIATVNDVCRIRAKR